MPRKRDPSRPPGALATAETTAATLAMTRMARVFRSDLPRSLFKALKWGLYQDGKAFKKQFREDVKGRFKVTNSKVGNLFRVYTAGDTLGTLMLGMFSIWEAAPMYEGFGEDVGGVIRPTRKWLLFAVAPEALTPGGRVRRAWRDPKTGRFAEDKVKGLIWVPHRPGVYLLIRPPGPGPRRSKAEVIFVAIRVTSRTPKLSFFRDWERYMQGGKRLENELNTTLERAMAVAIA